MAVSDRVVPAVASLCQERKKKKGNSLIFLAAELTEKRGTADWAPRRGGSEREVALRKASLHSFTLLD